MYESTIDNKALMLYCSVSCDFRRFSVDQAEMKKFISFFKELHCLPDEINFSISYTDPRNGDLLPINNDDNLLRAFSTAMPLIRLFIYREKMSSQLFGTLIIQINVRRRV